MVWMNTFLGEVRQTIIPGAMPNYGPLPPLLLGLTVVTGLVDAFSYLTLGHVFVANMTGNVVFLAFSLVGVNGFSIGGSLIALGAFILGAFGGGMVSSRLGTQLGHLLSLGTGLQMLFLAASLVLATLSGNPSSGGYRYGLITSLAIAMGIQNATARRLAVPDLTTTVLTMTLTGLGADARIIGGSGAKAGHRVISIGAMLLGALIGAVLILHVHVIYPLVIALVLTAVIAVTHRLIVGSKPS